MSWFGISVFVLFGIISCGIFETQGVVNLGYVAPQLYLKGIRLTKTITKPVTEKPKNSLKLVGIKFWKMARNQSRTQVFSTFLPFVVRKPARVAKAQGARSLHMDLSPSPAKVDQNALVPTDVLIISGYENDTGDPLDKVEPFDPSSEDYQYFTITHFSQKQWKLTTRRPIDKNVGYKFSFRLQGVYIGLYIEKTVVIEVVEPNIYAPTFEQKRYDFLAYSRSYEEGISTLGTVKAYDNDTQKYNSDITYSLTDKSVTNFFNIDPYSGEILIVGQFQHGVSQFTFNVSASDNRVPRKTGTALVVVNVTYVKAPEIFCVSVEGVQARICWKDPTNGANVERYQLQISMNDQNVTSHPVVIRGKKNEVCTQVRANSQQRAYKFTVKVFNETFWSPESVQRFVNITKDGLYGDCANFSDCSVIQPCANGGTCKTLTNNSYRCECRDGFQGQNCTDIDFCAKQPCKNNGTCTFVSNNKYTCTCPPNYFGVNCAFKDSCLSNPCLNNGKCRTDVIFGTTVCDCPPYFSGPICENPDPCRPSPCQHGAKCNNLSAIDYNCTCKEGYRGDHCEKTDPCYGSPCNNGECNLVDDHNFNCTCIQGFKGHTCNIPDPCYPDECKNNGRCTETTIGGTRCDCPTGYWGELCEFYNACAESNPCANGICHNKTDGTYTCACDNGRYGAHCEHVNPCFSQPCLANGVCTNTSSTDYVCDCLPERFGKNCEFTDGCKLSYCENGATCNKTNNFGNVSCTCKNGTYGKFCQHVNLCVSSPCQHGDCVNTDDDDFSCMCSPGWVGKICDTRDPCLSRPCLNHGTCRHSSGENPFVCDCKPGFYGTYCDKFNFCAHGSNMCYNNATCGLYDMELHQVKINRTMAMVSNWFKCNCSLGYKGDNCDNEVHPCQPSPCGSDGVCQLDGKGSYFCRCSDNTSRPFCKGDSCAASSTLGKKGKLYWPETLPGHTVSLECPHGSHIKGHASRKCSANAKGEAFWENEVTKACLELSAEEAESRLKNLIGLTDDASHLTPEVIAKVTYSLENLVVYAFDDNRMAHEVAEVVSNLLEAQENAMLESNRRDHSSERLVELLHDYTSEVQTDSNTTIETENVNIMVVNFSVPQTQEEKTVFSYSPELKQNNHSEQGGISISLPMQVFEKAGKKNVRLEFVSYRTSGLFLPNDSAPPPEVVLKQRVITATVHDALIRNLTHPVEYSIDNIEVDSNHTCVYWDIPNRKWSTDGMETVSTGGHMTDCRAYHMTSFAVLLDPSPSFSLEDKVHDTILTSFTYTGCAISIIGLSLTIITFSMFRSLNRERSGKILLNMCVSLLLMNISFIFMSQTSRSDGDEFCMLVAILIHYFLLTSLTWMCTEAVNMYQALITVFTKYSSYFILKRCVVAWGLPAVVVGVTMGVNSLDNYRSKTEFCFISQSSKLAFYITLLGPACCILIVNTVIFTLVARVIMKPKFKGHSPTGDKQEKVTPAQVRGAFTVMVLLGITWVFGPIAIDENSKLVFYYLFTILNSLQGFLIFVFRCLFNTEVRSAWVLLLKTGKFKRRRGPIKSESNTSKAYHESRMNGSTADHTSAKTNLTNSNGWQSRAHVLNNERKHYDMNKNKSDEYGRRHSNESNGRSHSTSSDGRRNSDDSGSQRHSFESNGSIPSSTSSRRQIYDSKGNPHYGSEDHRHSNGHFYSDFTKL